MSTPLHGFASWDDVLEAQHLASPDCHGQGEESQGDPLNFTPLGEGAHAESVPDMSPLPSIPDATGAAA